LQGAELAAVGIGIDYQRRSVGVDDGSQGGFVLAYYYEHDIDAGEKKFDGGGEEVFAG
jgi:hypothetical protein